MKTLKTFKEFEKLDIEIRAKAAEARKKNPGKSSAQINKKKCSRIKERFKRKRKRKNL